MKLFGHTENGQCIVIMDKLEYEALQIKRLADMPTGPQLRMLRKRKKMTLRDVAEETGVSVSFLSDIERGRGNPSIKTYKTITAFFEEAS